MERVRRPDFAAAAGLALQALFLLAMFALAARFAAAGAGALQDPRGRCADLDGGPPHDRIEQGHRSLPSGGGGSRVSKDGATAMAIRRASVGGAGTATPDSFCASAACDSLPSCSRCISPSVTASKV